MKTLAETHLPSIRKHLGLFLATLVCVVAFVFASPAVPAKDKSQQRAAARALIQKAVDISDLRAPGSPPFELRGTITIPLKAGQSATGSYLLDWVSPDRWREEIHVANYSRIRVGGAGKYWQLRSLDYELIPFFEFSGSFDVARRLRYELAGSDWSAGSKARVSISYSKINKRRAACVLIDENFDKREFCFDSVGGMIIRDSSRQDVIDQSGVEPGDATTYSGFATFGGKLVPGKMEIGNDSGGVLSFMLSSIGPLGTVGASLFSPPQNADIWPSCDDPSALTPPKLLHHVTPEFNRFKAAGSVVAYILVGTDGAVHSPKILAASFAGDVDATLKALKTWKYQPATCRGVPEPQETTISFNFTNGLRQ